MLTTSQTIFIVIGVSYVASLLMRLITWLDEPRKKGSK